MTSVQSFHTMTILFTFLAFNMPQVYAEDKKGIFELPIMFNVRSNHSNDLLSVKCSPTEDEFIRLEKNDFSIDYSKVTKMKCKFEQVLFQHAATEVDIDKELAENENKLKAEGKNWKSICDNTFGLTIKIQSIKDSIGETRLSEPLDKLEKACKTGTSEDVKNQLRNLELLQTETCTVTTKSWTSDFRRTLPKKWISQEAPDGLCNSVVVEIFESDEKGLWDYKSTRVDADKGELCKHLQSSLNQPRISSQKFPLPIEMKCSFFK